MRNAKTDKSLANSGGPWWLKGLYPLLWFAIGGFLLYGQSLGFSYTHLDDTNLILNQMEKIGHLSYVPQAFREDVFHTPGGGGYYYRPLLTVSFVLDAVAGKGGLAFFHFSNILFHILATFLLFRCLSALQRYDRLKSFLFSLIFLFHPLVTQAVAWIPGRNDTLLAVFILASFYLFLRYIQTGEWKYLAFHAATWFFALLTKETAIILPLLLFPAGLLIFKIPSGKLITFAIVWFLVFLIWFPIRAGVLGYALSYQGHSIVGSLWHNIPAILPFLGKSIFPVSLSVFPVFADMMISTILGGIGILVLILLVFLSRPVKWHYFVFAMAWFLFFLLPTFIKHTQSPDLTEHRVYLPLIGIIFFFMETGPVRKMDLRKTVPGVIMALIIVVFAVLTLLHLQNFKDRYAFWQNAIKSSPSHAYNYNTLGAMYFLDENLDQAKDYFRKALSINPSEPQANGNMGLVYMRKGEMAEAEIFYRKEIEVNPVYDHVYYNYGLLYYNTGRVDSALISWEKTIEINPAYANAYQALLQVYQSQGRQGDYIRIGELARQNGLIETNP